jgi:hypothetical protein
MMYVCSTGHADAQGHPDAQGTKQLVAAVGGCFPRFHHSPLCLNICKAFRNQNNIRFRIIENVAKRATSS